jgi:hypothetical protein
MLNKLKKVIKLLLNPIQNEGGFWGAVIAAAIGAVASYAASQQAKQASALGKSTTEPQGMGFSSDSGTKIPPLPSQAAQPTQQPLLGRSFSESVKSAQPPLQGGFGNQPTMQDLIKKYSMLGGIR